MATAALPQDPDLDQLRSQARELQRAVRRGERAALTRVSRWHPSPPPAGTFPLTAAQLVSPGSTASRAGRACAATLRS